MIPKQMLQMMRSQQGAIEMPKHEPPAEGSKWVMDHLGGMANYNMASIGFQVDVSTLLKGEAKRNQIPATPSQVIESNNFSQVKAEEEQAPEAA